MDKQVHPNEIKFMKKEFQRLEDSMNKGFADIKAELKILNRSYVSKEELDKKYDTLCVKIEKKADKKVETILSDHSKALLRVYIALAFAWGAIVGLVSINLSTLVGNVL